MSDELTSRCAECGAVLSDGQTCQDAFHQMLFWEAEDPSVTVVHHLMVLCYHLQHPSLYSPEGLSDAKQLLVQFLEAEVTPQAMRKQISQSVDSGNRKYKITATPESQGVYQHPVQWTMTAANVTQGGMDNYYANVRAWAASVLIALRASDNLA